MAVGSIEPKFYKNLIIGLGYEKNEIDNLI